MAKKYDVCAAADIPPGGRIIAQIGSRSVGVFNVGGDFYALLNICPHKAANLCDGTVCGTNKPSEGGDYRYEYGWEGEILRCARHGWEFNIRTGESLWDPKMRAKTYPAEESGGRIFVTV